MMKTKLYIFVFVAAMGLSAAVAGAQEPLDGVADGPRVMTLRDCMEYAISNSTKIRIQQAAIGDAQIDRRDAALALFTPQISAQTYAYYNFGRSIDPQTNTYFNTTSFHNNYGVSAGYDLFDGFKAVNNYKISKTGMLIADSQEKQVEADICLAVMEAYYNVVYYKRLCDVYEEQVAVAEQALAKARRQEELGQKGHADVIQMEADLADRQYDLTNTYNMYQDQKMTLADLMFWPVDEELNIDTSMPVWQIEPVATESVVDFALEHNPGIQIASWQELNAKRGLSTAKWSLLPTLGLYAGWSTSYYTYQGSTTNPFWNQFKNNGGEYVELSLSIPIWNRLSKHSAISRKQHALDKATAELDQKRRDVESEVRRAIQDRDGAATAYQQAQRKAEVQAEAYTLNLKKLEQGLISPLEFQTANNNYLKALPWWLGALLLVFVIYLIARPNNKTLRVDKDTVTISSAVKGEFNDYIRISGRVQPMTTIQLSPQEGGIVEKILIEEGSPVKAGDAILILNNDNLDLQILNSEAELAEKENILRNTQIQMEQQKLDVRQNVLEYGTNVERLRRAYEQQKALYEDKLIAKEEYLKAEEDYQLALQKYNLMTERSRQDSLYRGTQIDRMEESLENMQLNMSMIRRRKSNLIVKAILLIFATGIARAAALTQQSNENLYRQRPRPVHSRQTFPRRPIQGSLLQSRNRKTHSPGSSGPGR